MSFAPSPLVRQPAVAGTWYPSRAPELRRTIETYLDRVTAADLPGAVLALVTPHAGYTYSGPTAAHAFAQVRGLTYSRIVLFGPLHRPIRGSRLGAFMAPDEDVFRTPLGDIPVDRTFLTALGGRETLTPVRGDQEHSLEIELPFLQVALGAFSLAPIIFGEHLTTPGAAERIDRLTTALAELWDEHTLLVASTDLSHLNSYADVVRIDRELVGLVDRFDVEALLNALRTERVQACGAAGLITGLLTARKLNARGARVLAYATSGDVTGNTLPGVYTVGYMAAAAYR